MMRVGIAADHGGFDLKVRLTGVLKAAGYEVSDFGASALDTRDDYPDFVVPLARAVSRGAILRGVAICGSGVGACVAANKVSGVRAAMIADAFSAHQGVEDDDMNVMCLGGLVVGPALAWELTRTFLAARFGFAERHCRRLAKVAELEDPQARKAIGTTVAVANDPTALVGSALEREHPSHERPLRVHLVRHGETEWSLSGQYTGCTDIPLTEHGEDEAREVGQRLRGVAFVHVLTSPLQRAQQTCSLAALGPRPKVEPDLTEWNNGDDEGRTPAEVLRSRPGWNLFRDGSPHGETPSQVSARADRVVSLLRTLDGNVALFSHGHFGRVLAARWIGLSIEQAQHFLLDPASLSVLRYDHDCADQPAIELWNAGARNAGGATTERGIASKPLNE